MAVAAAERGAGMCRLRGTVGWEKQGNGKSVGKQLLLSNV